MSTSKKNGKKSMAKSSKIRYGKVDIIDGDLDIRKGKTRITTMVDFPVYEALKREAAKKGMGYQTLMNMILSDHFEQTPQAIIIDLLKEDVERLKERVYRLEKKRRPS